MPSTISRTPFLVDDETMPTPDAAFLLLKLATVRIARIHREIAASRRAELAAKTRAYQSSTERSASGREDEARYAAAHLTAEFVDLMGERDAVAAEIDFLKQYLHLTVGKG